MMSAFIFLAGILLLFFIISDAKTSLRKTNNNISSLQPSTIPFFEPSTEPSSIPSASLSTSPNSILPPSVNGAQCPYHPCLPGQLPYSFSPDGQCGGNACRNCQICSSGIYQTICKSCSLIPSLEPSTLPSSVSSAEPSTETTIKPLIRNSFSPNSVLPPNIDGSQCPYHPCFPGQLPYSFSPDGQCGGDACHDCQVCSSGIYQTICKSCDITLTSVVPSTVPSEIPTVSPSSIPTSIIPTFIPSTSPSSQPTLIPSIRPSAEPSSLTPSVIPSLKPSFTPTASPTLQPTTIPSVIPTAIPSAAPSFNSTSQPGIDPDTDTNSPSRPPTPAPFPFWIIILCIVLGLCCCIICTFFIIYYIYSKAAPVEQKAARLQADRQFEPEMSIEQPYDAHKNSDGSFGVFRGSNLTAGSVNSTGSQCVAGSRPSDDSAGDRVGGSI